MRPGVELMLSKLREGADDPLVHRDGRAACRRLLDGRPEPRDRGTALFALEQALLFAGEAEEVRHGMWDEAAAYAREHWGIDVSRETWQAETGAAIRASHDAEDARAAAAARELDLPGDVESAAALVERAWRGVVTVLPPREVIEAALGGTLVRHCQRETGTTYIAGGRVFRVHRDGDVLEAADLMSVGEAAEVYGCGRRTVQSALERGALTGSRVGDRWVLTPADLAAWAPAKGPGWLRGRERPRSGSEDRSTAPRPHEAG